MRFIKALKEEDERKALMATLLFILLMVLFFLLASMEIPDPPLEEEIIEIEMDFGAEPEGGSSSSEQPVTEPVTEAAEHVDTQEESPVQVVSGNGSSSNSQNTTTPDPDPDPEPTYDQSLAFGGNSSGNTTGDGTGFGQGQGVDGNGPGTSGGPGETNTSRKLLSSDKITEQTQDEGVIALDLYVNEFGKVVRVKYNEAKSNGGKDYLITIAKKNAMTFKYEPIPGAPVQFVGTVPFKFVKQ